MKPGSGLNPTRRAPEPPAWRRRPERVTGEGLAAHDGEHADDRRDDRDHRRRSRAPCAPGRWRRSPARRASARAQPASRAGSSRDGRALVLVPGPATTRTRPWTLRRRRGARRARSAPRRARPRPSCRWPPAAGEVDDPVHHRAAAGSSRGRRAGPPRRARSASVCSRSTISWALRRSRLASGSSSRSSRGRLMRAWAIRTRCCSPPESVPDPGVGEALGVDGVEHLVDQRSALPRGQPAGRSGGRRCRARRGRGPAAARPGRGRSSAGRSRPTGCAAEPGAPSTQHRPGARRAAGRG